MKSKVKKLKYIGSGKIFLSELGKTVRNGEIVELKNIEKLKDWEWETCTDAEFNFYNSHCPACGRPYELKSAEKGKIKIKNKGEK